MKIQSLLFRLSALAFAALLGFACSDSTSSGSKSDTASSADSMEDSAEDSSDDDTGSESDSTSTDTDTPPPEPKTCETDADCPQDGPHGLNCQEGLCKPANTPPAPKDCLNDTDCEADCASDNGCACVQGSCQAKPAPPATSCETDEDCVTKCPPTATMGCGCFELPNGNTGCRPLCKEDADCPQDGPQGPLVCREQGFCGKSSGNNNVQGCTEDADCEANCPSEAPLGCACATLADGSTACRIICEALADCPVPPDGAEILCEDGYCSKGTEPTPKCTTDEDCKEGCANLAGCTCKEGACIPIGIPDPNGKPDGKACESDEDCFWPGFIPYTCVDNVCQAGTLPLKDCLGPEDCKDTCISPEGCDCVDGVCQPLPPKPPAKACVEDTDCEASCSDTAPLGCGCMTLFEGTTACAQKCDATTPCPPTASGEAVACNKGFCPPKNSPSLPLE